MSLNTNGGSKVRMISLYNVVQVTRGIVRLIEANSHFRDRIL